MNYIIVFIVLVLAELIYFKVADRFNIIDKPNERSSHTQITLRGGGVIFYLATVVYFIYSGFQYPYFFIGLTAITLISFLDDVFTLSNKIRIIIQLSSVLLMFYQWGLYDISLLWILPALICTLGVINAYNFMDGINGITAWYSIVVLGLLAFVNTSVSFISMQLILYVLISSIIFSFFNFRNKAKAFAGDVGSVSMAFIIVYIIGQLIVTTGNFIYILFLAVYGIDTFWTIILRARNKENIFEAHRSHLYQYLANEAKVNKLVVAFYYGALQLTIGVLVILVSTKSVFVQSVFSISLIFFLSSIYLVSKNKLKKKYFEVL